MSGRGISWAMCKSAPRSRQITMPPPHHSIFYRPDALPATQPTASKHCTTLHYYNRLLAFFQDNLVSRYQNGKSSLDLNEARDDGVLGCSGISWTICKQSAPRSRHITTPTSHHLIFTGWMLFLTPNQQCQTLNADWSVLFARQCILSLPVL